MSLPPFATEQLFDPELYCYFYQNSLDPARADAEVEFMVEKLALAPSSQVLDLACGHGRHAIRLARRGHRVTGIDISTSFLERGRADAAAAGAEVDFVHRDMRALDAVLRYDAAICCFTAFGYFSDDENADVLRRVGRALKPGGRFLLDILNRDGLARRFNPTTATERDGNLMIDRSRFDPLSGRVITQRTYLLGDRRVEAPFWVRLYTLQELSPLLRDAGLAVESAFGDWKGAPLTLESPRLVVVARRTEAS
jgi:SAM-dependent methyltransferase